MLPQHQEHTSIHKHTAKATSSSTALLRDLFVLARELIEELWLMQCSARPLGLLDLVLQKLPIVLQRLEGKVLLCTVIYSKKHTPRQGDLAGTGL